MYFIMGLNKDDDDDDDEDDDCKIRELILRT